MNTFNLKTEIPMWILVILPMIYLGMIWNTLPEQVPIHFNAKGEVDGMGSKNMLIYLSLGMTLGTYLLMLLIPKIDPKNKINQMGKKFDTLRLLLVLFMSALACLIIYTSANTATFTLNWVFIIIGMLIAVLGNYFQSIRPNYFVGIRTPWTLENEKVWKKTHRLAGRIWMPVGVLLCFLPFVISGENYLPLFLIIIGIITIIPVVYSYLEFKKEGQMLG